MPQRSNSARYLWGDRNPISVSIQYAASAVAPHGVTQRASYTVPAGKKAKVSQVYSHAYIRAVATTAGLRLVRIPVVIAAVTYYVMQALVGDNENTIGIYHNIVLGDSIQLQAGSSISIETADLSTGGTMDYVSTIMLTEYDA